MIIGIADGETYVASDVPAILKYTRNVYYIGNLEFAKLTPGEAHFYDLNGDEIEKQTTEIKWDAEAAEKAGFEHFMMKEIHEQPKAVQDTLNSVIKDGKIDLSSVEITEDGVELDSISGRIAQQLYQKNKIAVQGFETMQFPDSFFDCVVGNVPFGNYKVPDKRYDRHNFLIHDYFIAKSLDLVRPGGVVAVVTSSGTMDKKDSSVREYLANRADLVGAIRLPNNAFQRNANTGVVADILFLQKRDRAAVERADWVDLGETPEGYSINQYFAQHPEMVLGEITTESTQYGKQETTVKPIEGADLAQQLKEAISSIHATITEPEISDDELDVQEEPIPADPSVKNFSFTNVDGQIYYRENSFMNKVELPAVTAERVLGMIALRETTRKLLDCQLHDGSDPRSGKVTIWNCK